MLCPLHLTFLTISNNPTFLQQEHNQPTNTRKLELQRKDQHLTKQRELPRKVEPRNPEPRELTRELPPPLPLKLKLNKLDQPTLPPKNPLVPRRDPQRKQPKLTEREEVTPRNELQCSNEREQISICVTNYFIKI